MMIAHVGAEVNSKAGLGLGSLGFKRGRGKSQPGDDKPRKGQTHGEVSFGGERTAALHRVRNNPANRGAISMKVRSLLTSIAMTSR